MTEKICARVFPFTEEERDIVVLALDTYADAFAPGGRLIRDLVDEIAGNDRNDDLQVGLAVRLLDIGDAPDNLSWCLIDTPIHRFVAVDRHGDDLVCEKCGLTIEECSL